VDWSALVSGGFVCAWLCWAAALTVVDVAEHRLPNALTLAAYPLALAWVLYSRPEHLNMALATSIACIAGGWVAFRFADLGFGDVKLLGSIGLLVGGSGEFLPALAVSSAVAGVQAVIFLIRTRNSRGYLPFGPALLAATIPAATVLA
jgi:leader peptidase (prepilin peptidase)/N-methyltransferase